MEKFDTYPVTRKTPNHYCLFGNQTSFHYMSVYVYHHFFKFRASALVGVIQSKLRPFNWISKSSQKLDEVFIFSSTPSAITRTHYNMEGEEYHLHEIVDLIFEDQLKHFLSAYWQWSLAIMQVEQQKKTLGSSPGRKPNKERNVSVVFSVFF